MNDRTKVTGLPYMYRDANNYKAHGNIVLAGEITEAQKDALRASLDSGEFFVPQQIGMEHLGYTEGTWTSFPNENDDHPFHELLFDDIEIGTCDGTPAQTVEEFVERFTAIGPNGWDSVAYGFEVTA